ncbi:MAG: hypothetical protein R2856_04435 [Caldilineaceae bacterium]
MNTSTRLASVRAITGATATVNWALSGSQEKLASWEISGVSVWKKSSTCPPTLIATMLQKQVAKISTPTAMTMVRQF